MSTPELPPKRIGGLSIASLAVGAAAFLVGWVPIVGLFVGSIAIVLGVIALSTRQSKPLPIVGIILGGIAGLTSLVILIVALVMGATTPAPSESPTPSTSSPSQSQAPSATTIPTPSPTTTSTPTASPTPTEASSLAARVEAQLKTELGVENFSDGLARDSSNYAFYITEIEDYGARTVRVYIQLPLTKDEAKRAGIVIFGLVGLSVEDLETLIVTDASGLDTNVFRREVPILNL